jgi:Bacterial Ig-like domain (group 2)
MSFPNPTDGVGTPTTVLLDFASILSIAATVPIHVGGTYQIPAPTLIDSVGNIITPESSFSYSSRNSNVATVSDSGLVTGVSLGSATIQVSYSGLVAQLTAAVLEPNAPTAQIAQPIVGNYPAKFYLAPPDVPSLGVRAPFSFS